MACLAPPGRHSQLLEHPSLQFGGLRLEHKGVLTILYLWRILSQRAEILQWRAEAVDGEVVRSFDLRLEDRRDPGYETSIPSSPSRMLKLP